MTRRGPGEGSIYQRKDGRWTASVHLGYEGGRRIRKHFYGRTRRDVQEELTTLLRAQQQGLPLGADERTTVEAFLSRWLQATAAKNRPGTVTRYEQLVRGHIVPAIGRERLVRLTPDQVQALLDARLAAGLSPRTVHHIRACLRSALNRAMRWGLVSRNAAALTDPPKVPYVEVQPLTPDQARRFIEAVRGDRLEALYVVALATGMRQGELLGLAWDDVDLAGGSLTVRHALQRVGGRYALVEPKTARSRRTIALPSLATVALEEHRSRQAFAQRWAGSKWSNPVGVVFTNLTGGPLDATNVTHRLQAILAAAGLPRQRFHDLRHGAASLLIASGTPMRQVMELLGHSDIRLTMNTYAHVAPAVARDTADRMDAALSG